MRAILKSELHAVSPFIDAAIYTALVKLRSEPLYLNLGKWNFSTEDGVSSYPLPKDYVSLRGRVYCVPTGQEESARYELRQLSYEELEKYKFGTGEWEYSGIEVIGQPRVYGIDYAGKEILISPQPSESGDKIFFNYIKDLGTPKLSVSVTSSTPPSNSSTMTLLSPDGGTLESTFTNQWFKEGFDAVRSLALYNLWTRWHGGSDETGAKAQMALLSHLEEINRLRGESSMRQSVHTIRRWI